MEHLWRRDYASRSSPKSDVPLRCDDTWLWHDNDDDDVDETDYSDDVDGAILMIPKLNRNDSKASDAWEWSLRGVW